MTSRMGRLNFVHTYLESFYASVIYAISANSNKLKIILKDFHFCDLLSSILICYFFFFLRFELMHVGSDVETRHITNPWIVNNSSRTMLSKDCLF